jgi:hypothetical protein
MLNYDRDQKGARNLQVSHSYIPRRFQIYIYNKIIKQCNPLQNQLKQLNIGKQSLA